jgi:GGDEF domain-containing protein
VITLKKYIDTDEKDQAMLRLTQRLIEGIGQYAVEGDPQDQEHFLEDLHNLSLSLIQNPAEDQLFMAAGSALSSLKDYNQRAASYLRRPGAELQDMVQMLTSAIGSLSVGGEENLRHLRDIETQVASARKADDIREVRIKLGLCLEQIHKETERQRIETARETERLTQGLACATSAAGTLVRDPLTGLLGRAAADAELERVCQTGQGAYLAVFVLDRMQTLNARFGSAVGDEVLRYFTGFLQRSLSSDRVFRWSATALLAVLSRTTRLEFVRSEIGRMMDPTYEHTIQLAARTIVLPITARWTVIPPMAAPRLLVQKIDAFIATPASRS